MCILVSLISSSSLSPNPHPLSPNHYLSHSIRLPEEKEVYTFYQVTVKQANGGGKKQPAYVLNNIRMVEWLEMPPLLCMQHTQISSCVYIVGERSPYSKAMTLFV